MVLSLCCCGAPPLFLSQGVAALEAQECVHLDLTVSNVLVKWGPGGVHAALADFGISSDSLCVTVQEPMPVSFLVDVDVQRALCVAP
jgi:hypothetical protein